MANSDKNILITPNVGLAGLPTIQFKGFNNVATNLTVSDTGVIGFLASSGSAAVEYDLNQSVNALFQVKDTSGNPVLGIFNDQILTTQPITGAAGATLLDAYGQVDASNCVFTLRQNQTPISSTYIKDSKDLLVNVDGQTYYPYSSQNAFGFMPVYEVNSRTFRVRENRLIIYNAPEVGSKISVIVRKTSTTKNIRRYPFSAATIGFGD